MTHPPPGCAGPRLIETPASALGPSLEERVRLAGREFRLLRPDAVDRLVDHPELGGASAADEYMPYWAHLWPAACRLAEMVLDLPLGRPQGVLEIGCGLGLPGLAALARGWPVTFSDYDAAALRFARQNAWQNGFHEFQLLHLDWRFPLPHLRADLVLASNPIYEMELAPALADFLRATLAPGGLALVLDQDLIHGGALEKALAGAGLPFAVEAQQWLDGTGQPRRATLYRIQAGTSA